MLRRCKKVTSCYFSQCKFSINTAASPTVLYYDQLRWFFFVISLFLCPIKIPISPGTVSQKSSGLRVGYPLLENPCLDVFLKDLIVLFTNLTVVWGKLPLKQISGGLFTLFCLLLSENTVYTELKLPSCNNKMENRLSKNYKGYAE